MMGALRGAAAPHHASATATPVWGDERPRRWMRFSRRGSVFIPLHQRIPRGFGTCLAIGFLMASAVTGLINGGHFETFRATYGEPRHVLARMLGLGVDHITISGIAELHEHEVLQAAGIDGRMSLAFFDAGAAREALEAQPLIREANVRKIYPGEISISITEREPYALWQKNGELFVISQDGTVIEQMRDARFVHLPLVVGDKANLKAREYVALLGEVGAMRNRIKGATLVSGRRWNVKFDNGVDVRLPENGAPEAMARLARLDKEQKILDRDVIAIDLRQEDRVTLRLTEEGAAARAEKIKPKKTGGPA
jgi:cell division protein FtsQ